MIFGRRFMRAEELVEELINVIRLALAIVVLGALLWCLRDVEPFKSIIELAINSILLTVKIVLGVIVLGAFILLCYKVYSWTKKKEFEKEMIEKGLIKYVNAKGKIMWGTPEEAKKAQYLAEIVKAIEEFKPPKTYKKEVRYQDTLYAWLKSRFPRTRLEVQRGASRPDIVVSIEDTDVAIEVKGPTNRRALDSIPSKLVRYSEHFDHIIIVLFSIKVNEKYYKEWYHGIMKKFPEAIIIRKY